MVLGTNAWEQEVVRLPLPGAHNARNAAAALKQQVVVENRAGAAGLALLIGLPAGVTAAVWRTSPWDTAITTASAIKA